MFALHIFLVPALIAALLGLHLFMIWRQLHTNYPGPKRTNRTIVGSRLWPSYTAKSVGLLLLVFGAIAGLGGRHRSTPSGPTGRTTREHHGRRAAGLVPRLGGGGDMLSFPVSICAWGIRPTRNFSFLLF